MRSVSPCLPLSLSLSLSPCLSLFLVLSRSLALTLPLLSPSATIETNRHPFPAPHPISVNIGGGGGSPQLSSDFPHQLPELPESLEPTEKTGPRQDTQNGRTDRECQTVRSDCRQPVVKDSTRYLHCPHSPPYSFPSPKSTTLHAHAHAHAHAQAPVHACTHAPRPRVSTLRSDGRID